MESIPLTNTVNAPLATSATRADASNVSPRPIPAEVLVSTEGDSIILNGTEYNLKLIDPQQRQTLISASRFLVIQSATATSQASTTNANQTAQLLALGTPLTLKLPEAITQLAQQNGVTLDQLHALAGRAQGYPLPNVIVINKEFQFANGTVIPQDPKTQLGAGEYHAKIALSQGLPILVLTPIQSKLEILIGAPINETQVPIIDKQPANIVIAKTEPAQIIATFLRKLESLVPQSEITSTTGVIPKAIAAGVLPSSHGGIENRAPDKTLPQPVAQTAVFSSANSATSVNSALAQALVPQAANELTPSPSDTNTLPLPLKTLTALEAQVTEQKGNKATEAGMSVNEVLQKAFNKAGALPQDQLTSRSQLNLVAELLKRLPQLSPQPLSQLSVPTTLEADILGLATLNLATPQLNQAALFMNASAISSLFQLLLGFRAKSTHNVVSQKLANYLELLQAKTGFSTNLLSQLNKAGGLEAMGQLASSLQLYQHASSETNGNLVWHFALPYGINQRQEQLEGKFEQEADDDKQQKQNGWHLQLKFNLTQGPLLISARCHQQTLDIQFKGNNQQLLDRVDNFLMPLGQKLSQIGFTPGELSTQIAQVPATLLPGDHFLVKTKA